MTTITKIYIPQFAANDDEVQVIDIFYENGAQVLAGDILADFEASKAAFELEAESGGYFYTPHVAGDVVPTGSLFGIISQAETPENWRQLFILNKPNSKKNNEPSTPYTKKALLLCKKHKIDIEQISYKGIKLTENDVLKYLDQKKSMKDFAEITWEKQGEKIALIGASPSAPVIIDALIGNNEMFPSVIFDDNEDLHGTELLNIPIVGPIDPDFMRFLFHKGYFDKIIIAMNSTTKLRSYFYKKLKAEGFLFANIVHKLANISSLSNIGEGNVILQFCNLSPLSEIGNNNYLSPYTSIEHDCKLDDSCSFGPGVLTSSYVKIEDEVKFGTGVFIEPRVKIGYQSKVASGSILTRSIDPGSVVKTKDSLLYRNNKH